jgi:hypothetical protein
MRGGVFGTAFRRHVRDVITKFAKLRADIFRARNVVIAGRIYGGDGDQSLEKLEHFVSQGVYTHQYALFQ